MLKLGIVLGATLLMSPPVSSQCPTLPGPNGTVVGGGDDQIHSVTLSFPFTFPGGAAATDLRIDTNGRIFPTGSGDASDPSESLAEFHDDPHPTIALLWDDMNAGNGTGAAAIRVLDNGSTQALIEFFDWRHNADPFPFTYQIELNLDGSFAFIYGPGNMSTDASAIVGCSPGNGHADPGESNLSQIVTDSGVDPSVYEEFGLDDEFDLAKQRIDFLPNGGGGYTTVLSTCGYAVTADNGPTCTSTAIPTTVVFTPDGLGGYIVDTVPSLFDPNLGASAGATSDDFITATGLNLGFGFPFPGGLATQIVDVDPNGRVVPASAGLAGTVGDWSPDVTTLETSGYPSICLWTDFNVTEEVSDDIYFNTGPGFASFTWNDVAQFGPEALPMTTQIVLFADGTVHCTLEDVVNFNSPGDVSIDDLIIGVSDGVTVGTPELDLSAGSSLSPVAAYEWFLTSWHSEHLDLGRTHVGNPPRLVGRTDPILGSNWDLQMWNMPLNATFGFLMMGFAPLTPSVPLDSIGITGCTLQVLDAGISFTLPPIGFGWSAIQSIPVPNDPAHIGLTIFVQGGSDAAPYAPLPVWFANSIAATIGI